MSLFLLGNFSLQAQTATEDENYMPTVSRKFGMSFVRNEALHQYSKNIEQSPMGIAFTFFETRENSRFSYGAEIGVSMYANESYTTSLAEKGYSGAYADVEEEDCYFTYQLVGRYTLVAQGMVNLYAEGRLGGATFFTDKMYTDAWGTNVPTNLKDEFMFNSTTFQASYGGGMTLDLSKINPDVYLPVSIDFNVNHVAGAAAKYRNVSSDESVSTLKNSTLYESGTSSIAYRFGVYYHF